MNNLITKIKSLNKNYRLYALVLLAFIIFQPLAGAGLLSSKLKGLLIPICVYAVLAVSLNLTVGILGELSLGHAGFLAIGAYVGAAFSKIIEYSAPNMNSIVRFVISILLGTISAAIFGILIGIPVLRLNGDYLAIVTLAFGEIIKNILQVVCVGIDEKGLHVNMTSTSDLGLSENGSVIVNGALGINQIPRNASFFAGILLLMITLFVILNLINSRSGRAIMAIRDNTIAAECVGINITGYKLLAFSISAAMAGAAGALYAHTFSSIVSTTFDYNMSIMILVYVVLGGIGNIGGSILAAVILYTLPELLRGLNTYRMLIYAIILIVMMLFNWAPGAIGWRERMVARIRSRREDKTKGVQ